MVIWKYELTDKGIEMPRGASVLSVQKQGQGLYLWALVDPSEPRETRHFRIVGTGMELSGLVECNYWGTVQDGPFVWHIFETRAPVKEGA